MKDFLLKLFFPRFCLGCQKEGTYLCQDCLSLIDISNRFLKIDKNLSRLYFSTDYENFIVKKLIKNFKYKPFAKDLSKTLIFLIIIYFQNLEKKPQFLEKKEEFILIPLPLHKKRLRWRGFNQAELIAKGLSDFLKIPLFSDVLIKNKKTLPQAKLPKEKRQKNVRGAFFCKKPKIIKDKRILLVDDVFTTGATMKEAARVLKKAGAKSVWGIVVAKE